MKKIMVPNPEYCPYRDHDEYEPKCLFSNISCKNDDCFPEGCILEDDA